MKNKAIKILLVEDEPGDAALIRRVLEKTHYGSFQTIWVTSLAQAKEELLKERFDLLLLDLSLPDATGIETVRMGREAAGVIPLVVLTGHDDPDFALSTLDAGAQDYLVKGSFHDDSLIRALRYTLARSKTEGELRESELKHRTLFEAISDAVLLLDSMTIIDCNQAAISLFACKDKGELMGTLVSHLSPPNQLTGEVSASLAKKELQRTLEKGENHLEWLHRRINGEDFLAEVILSPIILHGKPLVQAVVRDITQRKEAERKLILSEERFRKIFHEGPLGMALVTFNSHFFEVNGELCQMTGYSREELKELSMAELICSEDRGTFWKIFLEMQNQVDRDGPREYRLQTKQKTKIWVSMKGTVISADEGDSPYLLLMMENVTESKALMEQLAHYTGELEWANQDLEDARNQALDASRAKSQFMAVMSHEIRNPMNSIIGMADLLAETNLTHEQREYVHIFRGAGETLMELIDDILHLSRIESGRFQLLQQGFDLFLVVKKTIDLMDLKAREKGLQLQKRLHPALPTYLLGDPGKLRQIITNLLSNAIKFSWKGQIILSIEPQELEEGGGSISLLFSVEDSGIGIPKDRLEDIFEDFVQVDLSPTRFYGGSGLGLGICRRLVTLMEGEIWVKSQLGLGSTFYFTATFTKASKEDLPKEERQGEKRKTSSQGRSLKILLVEDSPDNRLLVKTYLKKTHHILTMVEDGEEAVKVVKEKEYDLILMDMQMPVMDGYMATRTIRAWEKEKGKDPIPIIALTAYALGEEVEKALTAGCDVHLSKPVQKKVLLEVIGGYG